MLLKRVRIAFDNNGNIYILKEDTLTDMTNSDYKVLVAWMHNNIDLLRKYWEKAKNGEVLEMIGGVE